MNLEIAAERLSYAQDAAATRSAWDIEEHIEALSSDIAQETASLNLVTERLAKTPSHEGIWMDRLAAETIACSISESLHYMSALYFARQLQEKANHARFNDPDEIPF